MIIDTHIHLSHYLYNQEFPFLTSDAGKYVIQAGTREQLIQLFKQQGIAACIDPAIDIESNPKQIALAERFPGFLFVAVGIHPTRTCKYRTLDKSGKAITIRLHWNQRRLIEQYADHPAVVAIGETGLDYHLARKEQHRLRQKMWFIWQLKLAHKKKLPVILHIREAEHDVMQILRKYQHCLHGGVCHCFSGSAEQASFYVNLGLKLGIGGTLLMDTPNKAAFEEAIIQTPLESLLLETDGPYVKPSCPKITKKQLKKARNTSLILPEVAKRIAELKNVPLEEVERITTENAIQLFHLDLHSD